MYLTQKDLERYWVLDVEGDSLEPSIIWVTVVRNLKTNEVKEFYSAVDFNKWHSDEHIYVTHNGISFDIPKAINKIWETGVSLDNVIDTLVLSYLYHPQMPDGHSLKAWGERLKCPKSDFEDFSKLSPEMVKYCIQDTLVTAKLFKALTKRMKKRGYSEESCEIEHKFRHLIDVQENNGFYFNKKEAIKLYRQLRKEEETLGEEIRKKFPALPKLIGEYKYRTKADGTPYASFIRHKENFEIRWVDSSTYQTWGATEFNIGSPKQRVERLLSLGWKPTKFTPKRNPKVDEDSLVEFAKESGIEEVQMIADWLVCNGRANMINTWLENLNDEDSCIHGRVMSCGAGSRRCTHSSPNTANIPGIRAKYGAEARGLWAARPDRLLVGIDASGLEGRVFIHYLGSKEAEEFMLNDPHTANAEAVIKALQLSVSAKDFRHTAKTLFYARLYGASDFKLGATVGGTEADGTIVRSAIDSNIPGFEALVKSIDDEWKKNDTFIETVDGGYVRCQSPHAALNYKFQSCGAIVMKQGAILHRNMLEEEELDALKVGDIHDEWQLDCNPDHADRVGRLGCLAIKKAGEALKMNIALDGEYSIGKNWAETH